jgi:hypothetical protein
MSYIVILMSFQTIYSINYGEFKPCVYNKTVIPFMHLSDKTQQRVYKRYRLIGSRTFCRKTLC